MTDLLEQVIARLKTLSAVEQDAIAVMILQELEDEIRWNKAFTSSPDILGTLAAEVMTEYRAGKTQELDLETLLPLFTNTYN